MATFAEHLNIDLTKFCDIFQLRGDLPTLKLQIEMDPGRGLLLVKMLDKCIFFEIRPLQYKP